MHLSQSRQGPPQVSELLPYEPFDERGHAVSMRQDNGGSWYHIEDVEAEIERLNARHKGDVEVVKASEACARKHQERAEALSGEVGYWRGKWLSMVGTAEMVEERRKGTLDERVLEGRERE